MSKRISDEKTSKNCRKTRKIRKKSISVRILGDFLRISDEKTSRNRRKNRENTKQGVDAVCPVVENPFFGSDKIKAGHLDGIKRQ